MPCSNSTWHRYIEGMDLYFERHDGQAVTTDDFLASMADANECDLTAFKPWYSQAVRTSDGPPVVRSHHARVLIKAAPFFSR